MNRFRRLAVLAVSSASLFSVAVLASPPAPAQIRLPDDVTVTTLAGSLPPGFVGATVTIRPLTAARFGDRFSYQITVTMGYGGEVRFQHAIPTGLGFLVPDKRDPGIGWACSPVEIVGSPIGWDRVLDKVVRLSPGASFRCNLSGQVRVLRDLLLEVDTTVAGRTTRTTLSVPVSLH